jgi:hypothetical protein
VGDVRLHRGVAGGQQRVSAAGGQQAAEARSTLAATVDLFAGIRVSEFQTARAWWERLLGAEPSFFAHDTEAVWELVDHGYLYVVEEPEHAGHSAVTLFVEDLDERVSAISERGIEPAGRETYSNGVQKVTYRDADGNELGLGGPPAES